jgi:GH25 family lysozyme M1 (1,4-beta-N-acetylmuramidase)
MNFQQLALRRLLPTLSIAVGVAMAVNAPAHAQFVQGIDVSRHQGDINWTSVKNAGIEFAFCKATEGVDFIDIKFLQNMANASAAGVYIGPYHYGRPDSFENDPLDAAKEANDFVDAIEPYYQVPGYFLRPVLDMEEYDLEGVSDYKAFLSQWVRDFNDVVEARLGFSAIIYAGTGYSNAFFESDIGDYDFWLANWNYAPPNVPPPSASSVFGDWDFWQYSSTGNIGGISPVDRDVYQGTLAELLSEFQGVAPTGDFDQDGDADGADFLAWQRGVGKTGAAATFASGNADGDSDVDAEDLSVWKSQFGPLSVLNAQAVPEPPTAVLLIVAAVYGASVSRRRN